MSDSAKPIVVITGTQKAKPSAPTEYILQVRVVSTDGDPGTTYCVARRFSQFEKLHEKIKDVLRESEADETMAFLPKMRVVKVFPPGTPSSVVTLTRSRYLEQYLEVCIEAFFSSPEGKSSSECAVLGSVQNVIQNFLSQSQHPAKSHSRGTVPWAVQKLQRRVRAHRGNEGRSSKANRHKASNVNATTSSPESTPQWFSPNRARELHLSCFGYLEKRGQRYSTWKRRWCELDNNALKYYKDDPRRYCLLGCVPLTPFTVVSTASSPQHRSKAEKSTRGKHEFTVHTGGRSLRCRVPDASLCELWCTNIRSVCAQLRSDAGEVPAARTPPVARGRTGKSVEKKAPTSVREADSVSRSRSTSDAGTNTSGSMGDCLISVQMVESEKPLAEGAYGRIELATLSGAPVVVKSALGSGQIKAALDQLDNEIKSLQQLNHPNIVRFLGLYRPVSAPSPSVVLEYCENESLWDTLRKAELSPWGGGRTPLDATTMLRILRDVCAGMAFVHSHNFIHRDLKSSNVLLDRGMNAKIADFGLVVKAKSSAAGDHLHSEHDAHVGSPGEKFAGTLEWMAPELLDGSDGGYTDSVDVYSFGIVASEVLSGRAPYSERQESKLSLVAAILDDGVTPFIPQWAHRDTSAKPLPAPKFMPAAEPSLGEGLAASNSSIASVIAQALSRDPRKRPSFHDMVLFFNELADLPAEVKVNLFDLARIEAALVLQARTAPSNKQRHRRASATKPTTQDDNVPEQPSHFLGALLDVTTLAHLVVDSHSQTYNASRAFDCKRGFDSSSTEETAVLLVPTLQLLVRLLTSERSVRDLDLVQRWVARTQTKRPTTTAPRCQVVLRA